MRSSIQPSTSICGEIIARLQNDRWDVTQLSHGGDPVREPAYREGWNSCSEHIERAVREFEARERMDRALRELAEAPCLDLRLKNALIGEGCG